MSDIDKLVAKHFACCGVAPCRDGWHQPDCPVKMRVEATDLAEAVAERVRERARVCSWCHGSGLHPGPYDDVPTCDRCAGRGVTFESNTTESKEPK